MGFPDLAGGVEGWEVLVEWSVGSRDRIHTCCDDEEEEGDGVEEVGHDLGGRLGAREGDRSVVQCS